MCKILDRGQKQDATKRELAEARCVQEQLAKVKEKWMLRRTKQIIADQLPRKGDGKIKLNNIRRVEGSPKQCLPEWIPIMGSWLIYEDDQNYCTGMDTS